MPEVYRLRLPPTSLPAFTRLSEMAWPSGDTIIRRDASEAAVEHRPRQGPAQTLILPPRAADALATPRMDRVRYVHIRSGDWELFVLAEAAYGHVIGVWHGHGAPVPPVGGAIVAHLGQDVLQVLRGFATPIGG